MAIEKIPYLEGGRDLCVTGACFLTASDDVLGAAIRLFEGKGAYVSHCAPIVRLPPELMDTTRVSLIEALEHGLTPTYASQRFQDYDGHVYLCVPKGLTEEQQHRFRKWLIDKMWRRVPYDYSSLFKNMGGHVAKDDGALFCSEAWGMAADDAGIERLPQYRNNFAPRPNDIPVWWDCAVYEIVGPFV